MRKLSPGRLVRAVAFSPDGRYLLGDVAASRLIVNPDVAEALSFWELPAGTEMLSAFVPRFRTTPHALTVSPDGSLLVYDHHLLALDPAWERLRQLEGRGPAGGAGQPVVLPPAPAPLVFYGNTCLAFSRDGRLLVAVPVDGRGAEVWDLPGRQRLRRLAGVHCESPALSPDNRLLAGALRFASVDPANRVRERVACLWDLETGECLARLEHPNRVERVAFSPDGTLLATMTTHPSKVRLWDVQARRCVAAFKAFRSWASSLAFHPGGRLLAAGADEGLVRLWDMRTHREVARLDWQVGAVRSLAFSPDSMTAAVAGARKAIVLWDVEEC
jgi:WD40 repeat protein